MIKFDENMKNCGGSSCSDDEGDVVFYDDGIQKIYEFAKEKENEATRDCPAAAENAFSVVVDFIEKTFLGEGYSCAGCLHSQWYMGSAMICCHPSIIGECATTRMKDCSEICDKYKRKQI